MGRAKGKPSIYQAVRLNGLEGLDFEQFEDTLIKCDKFDLPRVWGELARKKADDLLTKASLTQNFLEDITLSWAELKRSSWGKQMSVEAADVFSMTPSQELQDLMALLVNTQAEFSPLKANYLKFQRREFHVAILNAAGEDELAKRVSTASLDEDSEVEYDALFKGRVEVSNEKFNSFGKGDFNENEIQMLSRAITQNYSLKITGGGNFDLRGNNKKILNFSANRLIVNHMESYESNDWCDKIISSQKFINDLLNKFMIDYVVDHAEADIFRTYKKIREVI